MRDGVQDRLIDGSDEDGVALIESVTLVVG